MKPTTPQPKLKSCKPITTTIKTLQFLSFTIQKQKLADFHFNEFYFQMSGGISKISKLKFEGMHRVKNNLICDCHWSTIELIKKKYPITKLIFSIVEFF